MAYGNLNVDVVQSSTAGTPTQFNDGNGTQVGTLCRAWVNFNGSTAGIRASFNVTSVTKNGTGDYTANFTNAMADVNYSAVITGGQKAVQWGIPLFANSGAFATGSVRFLTQTPADTPADTIYVCLSVFR